MRRLLPWLAPAALLLTACADRIVYYEPGPPPPPPSAADGAGNWEIPLTIEPTAPGEPTRYCSADRRLCASVRRAAGWALDVAEEGRAARTVATWPAPDDQTSYNVDSIAVREAGGAWLIGVDAYRYREGREWGSSSRLSLLRLAPGAAQANQVLDTRLSGIHSIPLCPPGRPYRAPPTGCRRDYTLETVFFPDLGNRAGPPRFVLTSAARIFPGPHAAQPGPGVTPATMAETDAQCSYRRLFSMDPASGRYVPDAPLPDCADYYF